MNYYKLTYIDDFGNGSSKYFFCPVEEIKQNALELFEKEKKFAVASVEDTEFDKAFFFDETQQYGYVVKKVGFTLAHHIRWEEIFFNNDGQELEHVYLVKDIGHYMVTNDIGEFSTLDNAKNCVVKNNPKPNEIVDRDDDGNILPNGKFIKTKNGYSHSYFYDYKSSYEYDEWEIGANTFVIEICPIEKSLNKDIPIQ